MNWQNIPRDDKTVKRAVLPKRGALNFLDYSQIEPRLFAYFCAQGLGDTSIADWYREGRDVYREIASRVYARPAETITDEERQLGKVWFLMSLYGAGPRKMAQEIGMAESEAKDFYKAFHAGLPQIKALSNPPPRSYRSDYEPGLVERALRSRGYLRTPWGRHLRPEEYGEHKMLNKLIQGSAADMMKAALIRVHAWTMADPDLSTRAVSVIHDEVILDGPVDEIDWVQADVPNLMRDEPWLTAVVPIEIDHEVSLTSWADKVSYEEWKEADGVRDEGLGRAAGVR